MKRTKKIFEESEPGDKLSPLLQNLKKENPFQLPENYFEALPDQINSRIKSLKEKPTNQSSFFSRPLYPILAVAAMFGLVALMFFLLIPSKKTGETEKLANNSENYNAIEDYLINNANIDEESIVNAIIDEDNNTPFILIGDSTLINNDSIPKQNTIVFPSDTSISKDDILQYLLDEDLDIEPDL
jgi:hypothetical protein